MVSGSPTMMSSRPAQRRSAPRRVAVVPPVSRYRRPLVAAAAVVGVGLIAATIWFTRRPSPSLVALAPVATTRTEAQTDTLTSSAQLAVADHPVASPAAAGTTAAAVADPQDSALASAFAIRVGTYTTYAAALRDLRSREVKRGAATIAPLPDATTAAPQSGAAAPVAQSFVVYVGAARSATSLDSLAQSWARRGDFAGGTVTHTPYALRLTDRVSSDSGLRATVTWRARGIPAYALTTDDGQAVVYAGAFTSVDQVGPLTASLRAIGLTPTVAYRIGQAP